jgi:hypothetical protein
MTYQLTLTVEGPTIRDVEDRLIDIMGSVHELSRTGRPVREIDSHLRSAGATLRALPSPAVQSFAAALAGDMCPDASPVRSALAIAAEIRDNGDAYRHGTRSAALFHAEAFRLWGEASAAGVQVEVLGIVQAVQPSAAVAHA